jgi:hypothetical protein
LCDSNDQVTYCRIPGPSVGAFISEGGKLGKEKVTARTVEEFQQNDAAQTRKQLIGYPCELEESVRSGVLTVATMKSAMFWGVTLCRLVEVYLYNSTRPHDHMEEDNTLHNEQRVR